MFTSSIGSGGEIATEVAFVVVHMSVLNWPAVMVAGDAVSVAAGVGDGFGLGLGDGVGVGVGPGVEAEPPAQPATKMPIERTARIVMTKREIVRT